ncbi:FHA domain-containing protein [Verrucomicrobiota bacterium]
MKPPLAVLRPMTPEARESIQRDDIPIHAFPFRVGRESRFTLVHGVLRSAERRKSQGPPNNDLYIIDRGELLNVSREHFVIERNEDGALELVDRGSTCGTDVDGTRIGGSSGEGRLVLGPGSTILVGAGGSPYVFRFELPAGADEESPA